MAAFESGKVPDSGAAAVAQSPQGQYPLWALAGLALTPFPVYIGELTRLGSPLSEPQLILCLGLGALVGSGAAVAASVSWSRLRRTGGLPGEWVARAGWTMWAAVFGLILATWAGGMLARAVSWPSSLATMLVLAAAALTTWRWRPAHGMRRLLTGVAVISWTIVIWRVAGGSPTLWTAPGGFPANAARPLLPAAEQALLWRAAVDAGAVAAASALLLVPATAWWRGPAGRPTPPKVAWGALLIMALGTTLLLTLGSGLVQNRLASLPFNPIARLIGAVSGAWQPVLVAGVVTSTLCWLATVWEAAGPRTPGTPRQTMSLATALTTILLVLLYYLAPEWGISIALSGATLGDTLARWALSCAYILAPLAAALGILLWRGTRHLSWSRPGFAAAGVGWMAGLLASLPFVRGFGLLGSAFLHQLMPNFPVVPAIEPVHPVPDWALVVGMGVAVAVTAAASGRATRTRRAPPL